MADIMADIVLSVFVKLALLSYFRTTGLTYGADKIHKAAAGMYGRQYIFA